MLNINIAIIMMMTIAHCETEMAKKNCSLVDQITFKVSKDFGIDLNTRNDLDYSRTEVIQLIMKII